MRKDKESYGAGVKENSKSQHTMQTRTVHYVNLGKGGDVSSHRTIQYHSLQPMYHEENNEKRRA